jgi:SPP1 gp7 family putative phage head morphogenesis protein
LRPTIQNLSDAELRRLWPTVPPEQLRRHAPWATSRDEVIRIAFPGQGLLASDDSVEAFVRQAVIQSEASPWTTNDELPDETVAPGPRAFVLKKRFPVPAILGANGMPVPPPPRPRFVNATTIKHQLDWLNLATHQLVTTENLEPFIDAAGRRTDRHVRRVLNRVLPIDVREAVPGIQVQINQWRNINVNLIESGIRADFEPVKLRRQSLLGDVSELIERTHREGARVEVVAQDLIDRYGVSESRAQLIARDQVLKLNGQINKMRQQAAGVTEYKWRATKDRRTRKGHQKLDGTIHNWNTPPDTGRGEHNHPGQDYQCRCQAIPVIRGFVSSGDFVPVEQPRRTRRRRLRPV